MEASVDWKWNSPFLLSLLNLEEHFFSISSSTLCLGKTGQNMCLEFNISFALHFNDRISFFNNSLITLTSCLDGGDESERVAEKEAGFNKFLFWRFFFIIIFNVKSLALNQFRVIFLLVLGLANGTCWWILVLKYKTSLLPCLLIAKIFTIVIQYHYKFMMVL